MRVLSQLVGWSRRAAGRSFSPAVLLVLALASGSGTACTEDVEVVSEFDSMAAAEARVRLLSEDGVAAAARFVEGADDFPYVVEVPREQLRRSHAVLRRHSTVTEVDVTTSTRSPAPDARHRIHAPAPFRRDHPPEVRSLR